MGTSRAQMVDGKNWRNAGDPFYGQSSIQPLAVSGASSDANSLWTRPKAAEPAQSAQDNERQRGDHRRLALLTRAIELEVLPRLMLAGRGAQAAARPVAPPIGPAVGADEVVEYTNLLLAHDPAASMAYVETMRAREFNPETLFLDFLSPAARLLGALWDEDLCDFTQVTAGLMRLQQVLRRLSPAFQEDLTHRDLDCRALLMPGPGEQHSFGLVMVSEFFRRAGWDVWGGSHSAGDDPVELVRGMAFAVIGFSVCSHVTLDRLAGTIRKVRRASRNPAIGVMVGGPVFLENPELVARVGADATAADGRQAVRQAHGLLTLRPSRHG